MARTLAQVYRHFGEADAAGTSPLYKHVAVGGNSGERVHRLALVMLALAVMVAGAWAFSAARAGRRLAELGEHRGR